MEADSVLAIGVDGGASGVRALAVRRRPDGLLEAASAVARRDHAPCAAVDLAVQRAEAADPRRGPAEVEAARARVRATAEVVAEVAARPRIALGICWPGQKTGDGRGIAVMRNGPRDPAFLDQLQAELAERGLEILAPVPRLASDGVAGALGERWAVAGGLRDVSDALYFAGGSGLAEALLVAGRVRALDAIASALPKAFELPVASRAADPAGSRREPVVYEDALSPGRWSLFAPGTRRDTDLESARGRVDWSEVVRRDPGRAAPVLPVAADALVRYILDRMERLRSADLVPERAVVGARLGGLIALPEARALLRDRIVDGLRSAGLPPDFVRASTLLEAPCLGAAALALGLEDRACPH